MRWWNSAGLKSRTVVTDWPIRESKKLHVAPQEDTLNTLNAFPHFKVEVHLKSTKESLSSSMQHYGNDEELKLLKLNYQLLSYLNMTQNHIPSTSNSLNESFMTHIFLRYVTFCHTSPNLAMIPRLVPPVEHYYTMLEGKFPGQQYLRSAQPFRYGHTLAEHSSWHLTLHKLLQPRADRDEHTRWRGMASSKLGTLVALGSLIVLTVFISSTESGESFQFVYWTVHPYRLLLYFIWDRCVFFVFNVCLCVFVASCCLMYTKYPLSCRRMLGYTIQTINKSCDINAIM